MKSANVLSFIVLTIILSGIGSCKGRKRNNSYSNIPEEQIVKGEALAKKHCQSCHMFPDPSTLDVRSWEEGVLPQMGPHLGIFKYNFKIYPSGKNDISLPQGYYPANPVITESEWSSIINYYLATAPDSLPSQNRSSKIEEGISIFDVRYPAHPWDSSAITFLEIDTSAGHPGIWFGDLRSGKMGRLDKELNVADSIQRTGAITGIQVGENDLIACNVGQINPNDGKFGSGEHFRFNEKGKLMNDSNITIRDLGRPVQIIQDDVNEDGKKDYVACEFGYRTGALTYHQNLGDGNFQRHVISTLPGAIKAYVQDFDSDGKKDIAVLFAQGEEGVYIFNNKGDGKFDQKILLRFPPNNGSTYFEFVDLNSDGVKDILYTCGDNADYSPVLKPYHGVYLFLNDGKDQFVQHYFFPMNGCFKAMANDYDKDGDLDIAAIAFFADYERQPEEGFVYLENTQGTFLPKSIKVTQAGRWLTMDAADYDRDGKIDIVLGNFSVRPSLIKSKNDWKKGPPILILKNISSK